MDVRPAILVREIAPAESLADVVEEAKGLTWTHRAEHALICIDQGALLLVRGGADGVSFEAEGNAVFVMVDGKRCRVTKLAWHTHPWPTGPSDHDIAFLRALRQPDSLIYEMFADGLGTRFYAKNREVI